MKVSAVERFRAAKEDPTEADVLKAALPWRIFLAGPIHLLSIPACLSQWWSANLEQTEVVPWGTLFN
jgi:hypothetical protein